MPRCFHDFEGGHGLCGDAYTCKKCDRSKYPEALSLWDCICLLLRPWLFRSKRKEK